MNVIGFVFCILAVLSLGASFSLEKQVSAHRLRSSYLGHIAASREILDQTTSEFYASLKCQPGSEEKRKGEKKSASQNTTPSSPPPINPLCARLDLSLLIEKGLEEKALYEAAAKLLRIFYKDLFERAQAETRFLDALLKVVRLQIAHQEFSGLEKVSFKDPHFQMVYYKMLKGTKKNDVLRGIGYPSFLDYVKIESSASKICLRHAHPNLLSVFFTAKGGTKLYEALHTPNTPPVMQETIERICQEVRAPLLSPEVFDLFEISKGHDAPKETTLIGEDSCSQICLRKVVSIR
jgi:hypothetical protein